MRKQDVEEKSLRVLPAMSMKHGVFGLVSRGNRQNGSKKEEVVVGDALHALSSKHVSWGDGTVGVVFLLEPIWSIRRCSSASEPPRTYTWRSSGIVPRDTTPRSTRSYFSMALGETGRFRRRALALRTASTSSMTWAFTSLSLDKSPAML